MAGRGVFSSQTGTTRQVFALAEGPLIVLDSVYVSRLAYTVGALFLYHWQNNHGDAIRHTNVHLNAIIQIVCLPFYNVTTITVNDTRRVLFRYADDHTAGYTGGPSWSVVTGADLDAARAGWPV